MGNERKKIEDMLYDYTPLVNEIKNIKLEIEELNNEYDGCGAINYEEKSSPTNKFNSSVENEVIIRDKKMKYLEDLKRSKEIKVEKINNALEVLNERQRKVIELRYISPKKLDWVKIGEILNLTNVTCMTIKNDAIEKMIPIVFISYNLQKLM